MRILAIDPGGTTGIAVGTFDDSGRPPLDFSAHMYEVFGPACMALDGFLPRFGSGPDLVVLERFTLTQETAKKSTAGSKTTIEISGVVRYLCWLYDYKLEEQSPADAKNFIDDRKLKILNVWTPGPDHARDATRHLFLAAVRHKVLDPKFLLA